MKQPHTKVMRTHQNRGKNGSQNRPFNRGGNGQRVNYQQQIDRYQGLANDALSSGDRVAAENYFQHAEHFFRLQNERMQQRAQRDEHRESQHREKAYEENSSNSEEVLENKNTPVGVQEDTLEQTEEMVSLPQGQPLKAMKKVAKKIKVEVHDESGETDAKSSKPTATKPARRPKKKASAAEPASPVAEPAQ